MVKAIKPVITVLQNDEWQLLVLGITLLVFLTVLLYFSRYYYKVNYQVSDEFDPQTGETKPNVTAGTLKACSKKGYCVVNLETGMKKCPTNSNTLLYYDATTQACSAKDACPTAIPYAVNGDGSVNKYGTCEENTACNCTGEVTCARYTISKFSVDNGNIYSSYGSELNFIFEQIPFSTADSYNGKIKLDSTSEFCKINSSYSNQLVGGCSFLNQTNDFLMKCDKESIDESISVSPYSLDPYYYANDGVTVNSQYCEVQPYLDSNWNNMTLCVNQNPCKIGNYTYLFDKYREVKVTTGSSSKEELNSFVKNLQLNSRNFCQSYASNLDTYLTDLQYYTLSCTNGTLCNQLPNEIDETKFFAGNNNEIDISAINASYPVVFKNGTLVLQESTLNVNSQTGYNPLKNTIKSGDIVYNTIKEEYYIIRVNPWFFNEVTFYTIIDNKIFGFTNFIYQQTATPPSSTDSLTYYPQYALNGYNYNTVTTEIIPNLSSIQDNIQAAASSLHTYYKIGNVKNSPIDQSVVVGGGYNPSFDITTGQSNFYRAGLSKPRGYVFNEFQQQEATQEALAETYNQKAFNADNYTIKQTPFNTKYYNDISFYSPVWNNQYGRSECIRCTPLLVASINMAQNSSQNSVTGFIYDAVTIQFSGRDFGHYRKNFQQLTNSEKLWCYESRSKVNSDVISTPTKITLERPNTNIQVGDFILSNYGEFNYKILPVSDVPPEYINQTFVIFMGDVYPSNQGASNYTPFYDYGTYLSSVDTKNFFGLGVDNNTYQDFLKDKYIFTKYNGEHFEVNHIPKPDGINKFLGNGKQGGFLFGNKFQAFQVVTVPVVHKFKFSSFFKFSSESTTYQNEIVSLDVTIVPSVTVESISPNGDIITTSGYEPKSPFTSNIINPLAEIQFISLDRNLYLNNDMTDVNKSLNGEGGKIQIDEITDGRITSIKVVESGSGYSNVSPLIRLESYEPYFN